MNLCFQEIRASWKPHKGMEEAAKFSLKLVQLGHVHAGYDFISKSAS